MSNNIKYRAKIKSIIENNGYYSLMNDTKWKELKNGVSQLGFQPPFVIKALDEEYNVQYHDLSIDTYYECDWGLYLNNYLGGDMYAIPFYAVEYIKVRPRIKKHIGKLVEDVIHKDETEKFLFILETCNINYEENEGTITIYGYKK